MCINGNLEGMVRAGYGRRYMNLNQGAKDLGMLGWRQGIPGSADDPVCRQDGRKLRERRARIKFTYQDDIERWMETSE